MKKICLILLLLTSYRLNAIEINVKNINIIRDNYGVPHIYGKTDEEVAYGLAWATAEDDFESMQQNLLAGRCKAAEVNGEDGAMMDFIFAFIQSKEIVEQQYDTAFSPKFKGILAAYCKGANKYAELHPKEVLLKGLFPINEKDMIQGFVMGMALMTNIHFDIIRLSEKKMDQPFLTQQKGSNGIAVSGKKTTDGKSYLAINSHQPLAGPFSWYEAHLCSEEGWNIIGGTFPGGATIFHGVNENLGWAHTVSFADFSDVYKLEMHPNKKLTYKFDGKWLKLEEKKVKMKVKFWIFKIPYTKKYYLSVYGPTLKVKKDFYSMRILANMNIKAAEQWYKMNKSKNLSEFKDALRFQGIIGLNFIYADKEKNILYTDNGLFPERSSDYDWWGVLPGNTSKTLWKPVFLPFDSMMKIENPNCGYVFNSNNTPFVATAKSENIDPNSINKNLKYFRYMTNRGHRISDLFSKLDTISYDDFLRIKYDQKIATPAYNFALANLEDLLLLDKNKYPKVKETLEILQKWDRNADINSEGAAIASLVEYDLAKYLLEEGKLPYWEVKLPMEQYIKSVEYAQKHLQKHFGTIHVKLGDLQKLVRGKKELPVGGINDVVAATACVEHEKGRFKSDVGDSYIMLVKFGKDTVELQTVTAYGQSNKIGNKHYDDQMDLYVAHKTKEESLSKTWVLANMVSNYHPK
jgi:acyl-homoserine-lactone acylase